MLDLDEITSSEPPNDPGLRQLKGQIKSVMIPLLIKVFQLRLEVQQATSPPSRLESSKPKPSLEELTKQLNHLNADLKLLHIWNQSCQTQIQKVLNEAEEGRSKCLNNSIQQDYKLHPSVQKSFEGALLSKKEKVLPKAPLSFWKKLLTRTSFLYRKIALWRQT
jgi:hypothetical protein